MDENHFDRLPDDLLRSIFNKVLDAKTLCQCLSVSKRFASLVPQTDTVSLAVSPRTSRPTIPKPTGFLRSLINKFITKPLRFLHHIVVPSSAASPDSEDDPYGLPNEVFKSFSDIQSLCIQLPCHGGEFGSDGGDSLLKWKAEFGSEIESCVILGATSFQRNHKPSPNTIIINGKEREEQRGDEHEQSESESLFSNDELKLRVVWTISCLIAASARHYLLNKLVKEHPNLRNAVITDASGQGRLCMRDEQIVEMRNSAESSATTLERTQVPALKMKLWYVPELELPAAGRVMKGATLVVIRAVNGVKRVGSAGDLLEGAFEGEEEEKVLGEAVREMIKKKEKRTYTMEMDSF
ncbi:hypothetical protein L1049_018122 [Liquidambar formosana]|uniref:F-box domain-containing protein n=1 Tax=Liquidambar formosana TaxID=63359 RepID=A0AAP0R882_LIQFO